jgi:hypothetical protein
MTPVNVLIMIHGIIPDAEPCSPFDQYEALWQQLCVSAPDLPQCITKRIGVQWGQEMPSLIADKLSIAQAWGYQKPAEGSAVREDEELTRAQVVLGERVNYDAIRAKPSPNDVLMSGLFNRDYGLPIIREQLFVRLRESIILRGFGDVLYYCSPEGETIVRREVYKQILGQLDAFLDAPDVRMHIFGHSLGVTLSHDFLYGLFAEGHAPGFVHERQGDDETIQRFLHWRKKAQAGELKLGGLVSAASQLPLFVMRKPAMVEIVFNNGHFHPKDIGVKQADAIQWKIFYDIDDMLGFPTRRMYQPNDAILEVQVNTGLEPGTAHTGYWQSSRVIEETAELLTFQCQ